MYAQLLLVPGFSLYSSQYCTEPISANQSVYEIYPNILDQCDRCHASACNLSPIFFFCPTLHKFWADVFTILTKALGTQIKTDPLLLYLGSHRYNLVLTPYNQKFYPLLLFWQDITFDSSGSLLNPHLYLSGSNMLCSFSKWRRCIVQ